MAATVTVATAVAASVLVDEEVAEMAMASQCNSRSKGLLRCDEWLAKRSSFCQFFACIIFSVVLGGFSKCAGKWLFDGIRHS